MIWSNLYAYTWAPPQAQYPTDWPLAVPGATSASKIGSGIAGVESGNLLAEAASPEAGAIGRVFGADFYDRIHVIPASIDFGNLVGAQEEPIAVWNAYYRGRTLDSLSIADGDGISIIGGRDAPTHFLPLEQVTWTVVGTQDGPPIIDAVLSFGFDHSESIAVSITGRRVVALGWPPDWSQGIVERLDWMTDVIEAYDGSEQRRSLRLYPRRSLEFSATIEGVDRQRFEAWMHGWGARVWAVPVWTDGQTMGAAAVAGTVYASIDTVNRDYQGGGFAMISDGSANEVCEIVAVSSTQLEFRRPLLSSWPAGSMIYPAWPARLQSPPSISRFTGGVSSGRMIFDFSDPHVWGTDHGLDVYRGYPVLSFPINWTDDPEFRFDRRVFVFDPGTGGRYYEDETEIPAPARTVSYTFASRAEISTWRKALHAIKGKWGAFWVHTDGIDITMTAPLLSAAVAINFEQIGFGEYLYNVVGRKDIRIKLRTGAVFYRRIAGYLRVDDDTEQITIDSPLGIDITPTDVDVISFMFLARLESDGVELAWWTGDVVDSVITARGFRNDV